MKGPVLLACCWTLLAACGELRGQSVDSSGFDFFEKQVRPLLAERCQDCHNRDAAESELQLDSREGMLRGGLRGPAIVSGQPDQSLLVRAIRHGELLKMPPKEKLSTAEIAAIVAWIRMGAPWPNAQPTARPAGSQDDPQFTADQRSFWAFQKPTPPALPDVRNRRWVRSPIDAFILHQLDSNGLSPAPPADKRTLIRRATFDLTGIPPTPKEVAAFLADQSPHSFTRVVDRLLQSPRYGERWGRHWLDVARYADSNGLDENLAYANAFRYRDYVVDAWNRDKPYDLFVREQLAGDLLPATPDDKVVLERLTATGFLSLGAKMLAEDDPVKMQMDIIDEQVDTTSRAFMGLTLGCARCHDHKFDPIPTSDYYALAGIFKGTRTMENFKVVARWRETPVAPATAVRQRDALKQRIEAKRAEIETLQQAATKTLLREARRHLGHYLLAARELRQRRELLAEATVYGDQLAATRPPGTLLIEAEANNEQYRPIPEFVRQWVEHLNRLPADAPLAFWKALADGQELAALSGMAARDASQLLGEAAEPSLLAVAKQLQQRVREPGFFRDGSTGAENETSFNARLGRVLTDPKGPFALPADRAEIQQHFPHPAAAELVELQQQQVAMEEALPELPEAMSVADEEDPGDIPIHIRGSHLTLGRLVPRGFPRILSPGDQPQISTRQSGRLQFARWLTSVDHPLTARVVVNRLWLWHFGEALVRSPDNFGRLGQRPTHPQLLDWLALELVRSGWSLKSLHRSIMLSSVYQMSTAWNPQAAAVDPENRLWWRMKRRRLEAEAIRDALLAAGGLIDLRMGGSLLPTANRAYVTSTTNIDPVVYVSNRRSIYLPVVRSALFDVFQAFDFADPSMLNGQRQATTVAPQALFMMNSKFVAEQSRAMADRLLDDERRRDSARIQRAYRLAYSRPPSEPEVKRALGFVQQYSEALAAHEPDAEARRRRAWQSLCRALLSASEFLYLE